MTSTLSTELPPDLRDVGNEEIVSYASDNYNVDTWYQVLPDKITDRHTWHRVGASFRGYSLRGLRSIFEYCRFAKSC